MAFAWQLIESGRLSPEAIMAQDARLLSQLSSVGSPILHFYEWGGPCLTYGYFTDPARHLHVDVLERYQLQMARRPTGGGIIFHLTDFAFSVLVPAGHPCFSFNTLENYALINGRVAEAVAHWTAQRIRPDLLASEPICLSPECRAFCMAKPTSYDLISKGKKVGGAAQRRMRQGFLHQASLFLSFPPLDLLRDVLKNHQEILPVMWAHSGCLLADQATAQELREAGEALKEILIHFIMTI